VDSIVFAANATPFIVTASPHHILTVNGAEITSSAAEAQIFNAAVDEVGRFARIVPSTVSLGSTIGGLSKPAPQTVRK
jgi:hypothetical protein